MTQYLFIDFILSALGVFIYFFGLKKVLFNQPKTFKDQILMKNNKKGMPIDIGIKRLSFLKDKGLISDEIFIDSKELLKQSEMEIGNEKNG